MQSDQKFTFLPISCLSTFPLLVLFILCLTAFPSPSSALELPSSEQFHKGLSLQGFTGILNTPNAHVTEEGSFYGLYSNQKENIWRDRVTFQDDFMFSVGFFKLIEVGGRLMNAPGVTAVGQGGDLSGSFKFTSEPFFRNYSWMPVLAVGMQDVGGGAKLLQTKYAVLSEDIWRFRLSAGYGRGPDRMKGGFAGAEFKAHDWVYLLTDYDTRETNVGMRVVTPPFWRIPISFTASAKTSLDHKPGNFDVAVGFSMPLDFRVRNEENEKRSEERGVRNEDKPQTSNPEPRTSNLEPRTPILDTRTPILEPRSSNLEPRSSNPEPRSSILPVLREQLIWQGFLNVRIGTEEKTLVVEYENARFNHNELDALGLVAGIAVTAAPEADFDTLRIIVLRRDIAMLQVSAPLASFRSFLERKSGGAADLRESMKISSRIDTDEVRYVEGDDNPGMLKSSLVLAPGLSTWVGTDVGVFDYLLSLKPELTVQAWKGAVLNARWDLPISWSENLEDGKAFRSSRNDAQLERLMLFQGFKPFPDVMLNLGVGMFLHDMNGTVNEMTWSPGEGSHRIRLSQAWTEHKETHDHNEVYLASYRYYLSPFDTSLEGTAGKFFAGDRGFSLELKRFFEDTAVSLYYKYSIAPDDKKWQAVGIQFAFPLTPRRDMKPCLVQVRGADEWVYAQETTLKNNNVGSDRGNLNFLAPYPLTVAPNPTMGLLQAYQNRDRLNAVYIKSHLERLQEAWLKFGAH